MHTVDWSPVVTPLLGLIGALVSILGAQLVGWLNSKAKTDKQRAILDTVERYMSTEVKAIAQAELPAVKAALADGKITTEEARNLRDIAIARVKNNLGRTGVESLRDAIGSPVDTYLISVLEAKVLELKGVAR